MAFTGKYYKHKDDGKYVCAACDYELFSSNTKYDSGTGWPSFYAALEKDRILEKGIIPWVWCVRKYCARAVNPIWVIYFLMAPDLAVYATASIQYHSTLKKLNSNKDSAVWEN